MYVGIGYGPIKKVSYSRTLPSSPR